MLRSSSPFVSRAISLLSLTALSVRCGEGETSPQPAPQTGGTSTGITPTAGATNGGSTNGGIASGGSTNGGSANGGPTNGGSANGGSANNGGTASGGSTNGGSASGGSAGSNSSTGGAANGGSASGGSAGSNSSTGGAANGGSASGGSAGSNSSTGGAANGGAPAGLDSELVGWAAATDCGPNGTTGGGDATPITVTDGAALKAAMNSSDPAVILVSGRIKTPGNFSGRKNKTLLGINNAEIYGGSGLVVAKNIIVKNIKFTGGTNDSFGLSGSTCIWLDHLEVADGADGNLDIVNGTDFVTVSWSKFYYTKGHGHMLSNLVGNTQPNASDVGKERITFHHNWWGAGVRSRKPRVRYGRVHVFNNYYHYTKVPGDGGDNYDVGAGFQSKLLVENNYFDGSSTPITWMSDNGTAEVVERNNEFVNAGSAVSRGAAFTPPYNYQQAMEPAKEVKASVTAGAGVK